MALLVVLGAGSSHDFDNRLIEPSPRGPWRPPLARGLFGPTYSDILTHEYPQAVHLVQRVREDMLLGIAIEESLAQVARDSKVDLSLARGLVAVRFYVQDVINRCGSNAAAIGLTNFTSLVRQVEEWRSTTGEEVAYVTFNYDTLLESALARVVGLRLTNIDSYVAESRALIYKVHGSVDWWHPVVNRLPGGLSASRLREALIDLGPDIDVWWDRFERHDPGPASMIEVSEGHEGGTSRVRLPALAIPISRKDGFECPGAHIVSLCHLLPHVTHALFIGWRAQEADFLALLAEYLPIDIKGKVVTRSHEGAEDVRKTLTDALRTIEWAPDVVNGKFGRTGEDLGGFSRFTAERALKDFVTN